MTHVVVKLDSPRDQLLDLVIADAVDRESE